GTPGRCSPRRLPRDQAVRPVPANCLLPAKDPPQRFLAPRLLKGLKPFRGVCLRGCCRVPARNGSLLPLGEVPGPCLPGVAATPQGTSGDAPAPAAPTRGATLALLRGEVPGYRPRPLCPG